MDCKHDDLRCHELCRDCDEADNCDELMVAEEPVQGTDAVIHKSYVLAIVGEKGTIIFGITPHGKIELGEGVTPEMAGKELQKALEVQLNEARNDKPRT